MTTEWEGRIKPPLMIIQLMIIQQLLSIYYLPDPMLGLSCTISQFNHLLSLQDRHDYSHYTDRETEAQRSSGVSHGWEMSELRIEPSLI